ncbi:MAG: peptidoglycan DD-metalloendopeptidase family protein [Nitrospirae bacterium]|nr:peptidoglycan DD-metalloendopeptidase family protein [Nitrospirota bacterium]
MPLKSAKMAFARMMSDKLTTWTVIGMISVMLLLLGIFLLSVYNLYIFAGILKSEMEVIVYIEDNIPTERLQELKKEIEGFREVEKVAYISKDEGMETLSKDLTSIRGIIKELRENPLPDIFRISLVHHARNPEAMNILAERLKEIDGVDDVEYGKERVERLYVLISALKVIGVVVGGIIFLIVLFMVSNTIKLARIPFVIEGGVIGLISAIGSIIMLFFTYKLILSKIPPAAYLFHGGVELSFIPWEGIVFIIVTGILAGCLGGWTSVGRYLGVAIFLILCLNVNNTTFAERKDLQGLEREIEQSQKRLSDVDRQIKEKKRAAQKVGVEEKKVLNNIELRKKNLSGKRIRLTKVGKDMVQKEREIKRTLGDVNLLTTDLSRRRIEMAGFLNGLYKSYLVKQRDSTEIILSSTDYNDFRMRLKYQDRLLGEADRIMKGIGDDMEALEEQLLTLNRRHHTLLLEKVNLEGDKVSIERDIRQKRRQLAGIQKKRAEYEEDLKRLSSASAELKKAISSYEKQQGQMSSIIDHGFGREKGRLIWPIEGDVVSTFGRQKHPEFDEYIYKKGIEIAAKGGREIKAVYEGIVAYADWLKGYGHIVIIDHGNSFYSIYAHASRILVSKGARVKKGAAVALNGYDNANTPGRGSLYFEIRHNGEPVDPLIWLAGG